MITVFGYLRCTNLTSFIACDLRVSKFRQHRRQLLYTASFTECLNSCVNSDESAPCVGVQWATETKGPGDRLCYFLWNMTSNLMTDSARLRIEPQLVHGYSCPPRTVLEPQDDIRYSNMSLTEHRSSPSTVQFTYSLQPCSPTSLPTLSTIIDIITSLFQSALSLFLAQWSTIHFQTNKIFGPILCYLRHLLPYNDIRIIHFTGKTWQLTPLGAGCIFFLAVFLFFSKSTPIGILYFDDTNDRGITLDHPFIGCANYDTYAISISQSFEVYSSLGN
jgi:hypothetical protein